MLCRLADMEAARTAVSRWLQAPDQDWQGLLKVHAQLRPQEHAEFAPRQQLLPVIGMAVDGSAKPDKHR